jgi:hypothetical protein
VAVLHLRTLSVSGRVGHRTESAKPTVRLGNFMSRVIWPTRVSELLHMVSAGKNSQKLAHRLHLEARRKLFV